MTEHIVLLFYFLITQKSYRKNLIHFDDPNNIVNQVNIIYF